jgi:23S rRNA pseudouridine1911/1915/1917 synthase
VTGGESFRHGTEWAATALKLKVVILFVEAADAGKRLDSFVHERLPKFSRSRVQSWIKEKLVLVNGAEARASALLRGSESIAVEPAEVEPLKARAENIALPILYEDDDLIVVNKPAGMVVHAGAGHNTGTLVNALMHHFTTLSSVNGDLRPGIVHRLDRETSGVLVVARTDAAHQSLAQQFHDREVGKIYLALAHGRMEQISGRITSPITRDPIRRTRMTTKLGRGRTALTEYRVLEQFKLFSYLQVKIGSGRTHQIRVHLSSLKHPVFGDRLYGAPASIPGVPTLDRFFLHAHSLEFRSPSSGKAIRIESPLPDDLLQLLSTLRASHG